MNPESNNNRYSSEFQRRVDPQTHSTSFQEALERMKAQRMTSDQQSQQQEERQHSVQPSVQNVSKQMSIPNLIKKRRKASAKQPDLIESRDRDQRQSFPPKAPVDSRSLSQTLSPRHSESPIHAVTASQYFNEKKKKRLLRLQEKDSSLTARGESSRQRLRQKPVSRNLSNKMVAERSTKIPGEKAKNKRIESIDTEPSTPGTPYMTTEDVEYDSSHDTHRGDDQQRYQQDPKPQTQSDDLYSLSDQPVVPPPPRARRSKDLQQSIAKSQRRRQRKSGKSRSHQQSEVNINDALNLYTSPELSESHLMRIGSPKTHTVEKIRDILDTSKRASKYKVVTEDEFAMIAQLEHKEAELISYIENNKQKADDTKRQMVEMKQAMQTSARAMVTTFLKEMEMTEKKLCEEMERVRTRINEESGIIRESLKRCQALKRTMKSSINQPVNSWNDLRKRSVEVIQKADFEDDTVIKSVVDVEIINEIHWQSIVDHFTKQIRDNINIRMRFDHVDVQTLSLPNSEPISRSILSSISNKEWNAFHDKSSDGQQEMELVPQQKSWKSIPTTRTPSVSKHREKPKRILSSKGARTERRNDGLFEEQQVPMNRVPAVNESGKQSKHWDPQMQDVIIKSPQKMKAKARPQSQLMTKMKKPRVVLEVDHVSASETREFMSDHDTVYSPRMKMQQCQDAKSGCMDFEFKAKSMDLELKVLGISKNADVYYLDMKANVLDEVKNVYADWEKSNSIDQNMHWVKYPSIVYNEPTGEIFRFGGVLGGDQQNKAEKYNITTHRWTHLQPGRIARQDAVSVMLNDSNIFTVGGAAKELIPHQPDGKQWKFYDDASIYNMDTDVWCNSHIDSSKEDGWCKTPLAPMKQARYGFDGLGLKGENKVIVFAGNGPLGRTNTVEMYDYEKNEWMYLENMPIAKSRHSVVKYQGQVIVAGGDKKSESEKCFLYDLTKNLWFKMPPLNQKRDRPVLKAYQDKSCVIAVGHGLELRSFEVFDKRMRQKGWMMSNIRDHPVGIAFTAGMIAL